MVMRQILVALGLATASISAAYAQAAQSSVVKIGMNCTYEGGSGEMGVSVRAALRIAVKEINDVGGVGGRKIELVERDDKAKPDVGVQIAEDLVNKEKVVATIGYCNSGVAAKAIDVYQKAKVPLIIPVATGTAITKKFAAEPENYVFRVAMPDEKQVEFILKELIDKRGLSKIAVLADDTGYGEGGLKDVVRLLEKRSMKPVYISRFKLNSPDLSGPLKEARAAGTNAIFVYALGPDIATITKGKQAMGWNVQVAGAWGVGFRNHIDVAGSASDGAIMPQTFIQDGVLNERGTSLILQYVKQNNVRNIPCAMCAAQAYDAMYILLNALFQAKDMSGPAIKDALENLNQRVTGVVGTYNHPYTKQDHEALDGSILVLGQVKSGVVSYANPGDSRRSILSSRTKMQVKPEVVKTSAAAPSPAAPAKAAAAPAASK
ncbi:MAG: ABC transporter substrate-binding protein [Burkholderiales bacterium]|nr:ABC transporter substrate-binding protein [Burkholderiales bacterium]